MNLTRTASRPNGCHLLKFLPVLFRAGNRYCVHLSHSSILPRAAGGIRRSLGTGLPRPVEVVNLPQVYPGRSSCSLEERAPQRNPSFRHVSSGTMQHTPFTPVSLLHRSMPPADRKKRRSLLPHPGSQKRQPFASQSVPQHAPPQEADPFGPGPHPDT